ncbi:MAG: hypothetical protein GY810_26740 [Aureispira sp.]|nr:hypothetical protein [Aureispira sp.]
MKFWKHLKKVFSSTPNAKVGEEGQLLLHELIERSPEEVQHYENWLVSRDKPEMLTWIKEQYKEFADSCVNCDRDISFLMIPSLNGCIIHFKPKRWDSDDFVNLFDYFKEYACQELGYRCHVSDIQSIRKGDKVETTQRHFLKPPNPLRQPNDSKYDQLYGNIMVCLHFTNERLTMLKLSATHYCDRKYDSPKSFSELVDKLCSNF